VSGCRNYVASPGLSVSYHVIQGGAEVPWHSRQRLQHRVSRDLCATLYIIQYITQNSTVLLFVPTTHTTTRYTTKYSKDCEMSIGVGMPVRSTSNLSDNCNCHHCSTAVGRHCDTAWLFLPAMCPDKPYGCTVRHNMAVTLLLYKVSTALWYQIVITVLTACRWRSTAGTCRREYRIITYIYICVCVCAICRFLNKKYISLHEKNNGKIIQFSVYSIQHTVYSTEYLAYSIQYTVLGIQYTVYSIQYTVKSIQYTVYRAHYTVYITQYTEIIAVCSQIHTKHITWIIYKDPIRTVQ
jgi:hypothetical protein